MYDNTAFADMIEKRAEKLRRKLEEIHKGDPTVLSCFDEDFTGLKENLRYGGSTGAHAGVRLREIYNALLPGEDGIADKEVKLTKGSFETRMAHWHERLGDEAFRKEARDKLRKEQEHLASITAKVLGPLPENLAPLERAVLVVFRAECLALLD